MTQLYQCWFWTRDCQYIQKNDWSSFTKLEETKMKYDKIIQTDKATIPKEQKSLSDYL
jgi:hypothetical protein